MNFFNFNEASSYFISASSDSHDVNNHKRQRDGSFIDTNTSLSLTSLGDQFSRLNESYKRQRRNNDHLSRSNGTSPNQEIENYSLTDSVPDIQLYKTCGITTDLHLHPVCSLHPVWSSAIYEEDDCLSDLSGGSPPSSPRTSRNKKSRENNVHNNNHQTNHHCLGVKDKDNQLSLSKEVDRYSCCKDSEPMMTDDSCQCCGRLVNEKDIEIPSRCYFCIKLCCPRCFITCEVCLDLFCTHCSTQNYSQDFVRSLCLDCEMSGK